MPIIHTRSATPLDPITIEAGRGGFHVWLRKNITKTEEVFEGEAVTIWEADETYYYTTNPVTNEEVEADFDHLWTLNSQPPTDTDPDHVHKDIFNALAELGDILGGLL